MRIVTFMLACALLTENAHAGQSRSANGEATSARQTTRQEITLRVSSTGEGRLVGVDRGTIDGIEVGDLVRFFPRVGAPSHGRVIRVFERVATVELADSTVIPELGTRGRVFVPDSRLVDPEPSSVSPRESEAQGNRQAEIHPPWENVDEAWQSDQPLLTPMEVIHPSLRDPLITGRVYINGDQTITNDPNRSDGFYRAGADWTFENPWGRGGVLRTDVELNYRNVSLPRDQSGEEEQEGRTRVDRLSYTLGGTRFHEQRLEAGRFLQYGMPEFGVLDGVEWGRRLEGGETFGFSAGFMPEPRPEYSSTSDFQVAGFYRWISDVEEQLSLTGGFQKTLHNGDSDRDLLIGKLAYLPFDGWDARVSVWIDYYGGSENDKDPGFEFTRLLASSSNQLEDGSSLTVSFAHQRVPDLDRFEFQPPVVNDLSRIRSDRLSISGRQPYGKSRSFHGQAGLWNDQEDTGGDLEIGVGLNELFLRNGRGDLTLWSTKGDFSFVAGLRATYDLVDEYGHWNFLYELSDRFQENFSTSVDEILQHRVRGAYEFEWRQGWHVSLFGEAKTFDSARSLSVGFYLQRNF